MSQMSIDLDPESFNTSVDIGMNITRDKAVLVTPGCHSVFVTVHNLLLRPASVRL